MKYSVVHELPGRLRLHLSVPHIPGVDVAEVESHFHDVAGVDSASFNPRTGNVLIRFDGRAKTRAAIVERVAIAPVPSSRRLRPVTELDRKKKTVFRSGMLLALRPLIPPPIRPILAVYGALPIIRRGLAAVRRRELTVEVLDASAIGAAMATRDFLTASVISFMLKLGEFLEEWTRSYSRKLLTEMFHVEEEWAWVEREGEELRIPLEEVVQGDLVIARTGTLIPVDGVVLDGEALVNQSSLTGENLPVLRRPGLSVYAGTAVEEGILRIRAEQVGDATRAAKVVRVIEEAEVLKAGTQSRSEGLADRVVPFSFLASGLTFLLTGNAARAAAVLLVDFSCPIKLSTPLAILTSLARSARHRVLIKGGKYLENLAVADAFVLDKTGTLTEATPRVAEIAALNGFTRDYVLRNAACVEEHFPHPVATAVVRAAAEAGLSHAEEHTEVEYVVAHGIATRLHDSRIVVGSRHFVHEDEGVDVSAAEGVIDDYAARGLSVLYMGVGGKLAGLIAIEDPLREEARQFVEDLRSAGIRRIVLITGDSRPTAEAIAASVGIDEVHAQALPDRKVEIVKELQQQGHVVSMVGDGINDSPALAAADVGISMKHGADIAREASDVLLLEGTLSDIFLARLISREAMDLIHSNYRTIVTVNSAAMFFAVTGLLPPIFSATLHNLSTVYVGWKSLQPLRKREEEPTAA